MTIRQVNRKMPDSPERRQMALAREALHAATTRLNQLDETIAERVREHVKWPWTLDHATILDAFTDDRGVEYNGLVAAIGRLKAEIDLLDVERLSTEGL